MRNLFYSFFVVFVLIGCAHQRPYYERLRAKNGAEIHLVSYPKFVIAFKPAGLDVQPLMEKALRYWFDDLKELSPYDTMIVNIYFMPVPEGYLDSPALRGGLTGIKYDHITGAIIQADIFVLVYSNDDPVLDEILTHEIGHVLGFAHSQDGIMQPIVYDRMVD